MKTQKTEKPTNLVEKVSYYRRPDSMAAEEWQTKLRIQFAQEQNYPFTNTGEHPVFSDFELTNPLTKKTYKIAIRSELSGLNYCSCQEQ